MRLKKKIIIDEDFDFFVASTSEKPAALRSIKNKKKFILDEEEFIISKNRKHINVKIEDSIINKASPPSDRVSARPCNGSQAADLQSPPWEAAASQSPPTALRPASPRTPDIQTEAESEDDESEDSIIKTILENLIIKDTIPKSISNYLSFSKKPMNIEKIVDFEDIEELIKDI